MARRSQCSSAGDNPLDPNYLPPHYREEYRLAIDALVEEDLEGYYEFLQKADVVDFLSTPEIQHILGSVQSPQLISLPEQRFLESGVDGSSDTYWPIHSDQDVPDLDLGWPHLHPFIAPTEVTTLVNPPEPDMPSIKEQARRLIKNAQQVIAIAMDMFTDVDIFADVLNAAMRNVPVYIILDELNAHHFLSMVSNCRVNLQSIQFLRVRTVSGSTYQCRSGKSFKGQMMDCFLLTDCRAVLSGNYSFMWSFEKLHRCMAHLFFGQLVTTFDEEFRILYAQSQPLMTEEVLPPMEDVNPLQKREYPSDRLSLYREPRKVLSADPGQPDEWIRHPCDERMDDDWRMMSLKRKEPLRGPADVYNRFPSQQAHMDPSFDQGRSRIPMMENRPFKRHGHAEGVQGRYSSQFLQPQGMPDSETQGRHFYRGQQPYPGAGPGPEADYSGYDKFWNQSYLSADQYSEPQEMQPPDFDPVLNYLSSAKDYDQSSEKLLPAADLPFSSSHPRRLSLNQPYVCQTSPTPSSHADQKQFPREPNSDRKDPMVKKGLRNWRITSYLSAYDNSGDEGLPMASPQVPDAFEESLNTIQQTAPGLDLSIPKIPNVREFKVPAVPRVSQIPNYAKATGREQPKVLLEEPPAVSEELKTTPSPSESSSTNEGEKRTEEPDQNEPKTSVLRRSDSFRRKYNAGGVNRCSRLRSSLIFSSLEQPPPQDSQTTTPEQKDEESDKTESEKTILPFVSHVLGPRRAAAREPFEWSRYLKPSTDTSKPDEESTKGDESNSSKTENSKDAPEKQEETGSVKLPKAEQGHFSPSMPRSKPSKPELPQTDQPPKPLSTLPTYVDMNDPDVRLMFFKELAAKRKAKAAESKGNVQVKPEADLKINSGVKKERPEPKESSENSASKTVGEKSATADSAGKSVSGVSGFASLSLEASEKVDKPDREIKNDSSTSQSCKGQIKDAEDLGTTKVDNNQSADLPVLNKPPQEPILSNPADKESSPSHPPTNPAPANVSSLVQSTDENESSRPDSTSKESKLVCPSSQEVVSALASDTQNPESIQLETRVPPPPITSKISSSGPSVQSSSSDHNLLDSSSQKSPVSLSASSPSLSITEETKSEESSSPPAPGMLSSNVDRTDAHDSTSSSPQESAEENVYKSKNMSNQTQLDSFSKLLSSQTLSAVDSVRMESGISPEASGSEPDSSSIQSSTKKSEKDISESVKSVSESEQSISETEIDTSVSERTASESEETISEREKDVSEAEKSISEPEIHVSEPEKDTSELETSHPASEECVSESEKSLSQIEKCVSESEIPAKSESTISEWERGVSKSGKDISEAEGVSESENAVSELEKETSESEKTHPVSEGVSESETGISEKSESEKGISESEKTVSESREGVAETENNISQSEVGISDSVSKDGAEDSVVPESPKHVKGDIIPSSPSPPESGLPGASGLEISASEIEIKEATITVPTPADSPPEHLPPEISSPVITDSTLNASQSETTAAPQDVQIEATPPSDLNFTGAGAPTTAETVSCSSPLHESVGSVLSPEAKKAETNMSGLHTLTDTNSLSNQTLSETDKVSKSPSSTNEPTSEQPVPAENSKTEPELLDAGGRNSDHIEGLKESVSSGKANDQVRQSSEPAEVTSKQAKSSQSRYHSSTANVLSSSNLRDDTKLLLEQISAHSQSRNEATKESPVTDDEKEDKADKNAQREKERGINALNKGQQKSPQEREKLLERIQSMRKERKVYSRFEMST
ncbi:protein FAM83H isoform X1 [Archocentrus centrarchus]|uniref:protein FAM83H isoform X1 n=2 Tax=Archocentrus centrarchus TaxID=63155 RepID=UPI0011E9E9AE|nr:protein FAM83H-like isoform X1 [Archocentrus centrarchus]